MPTTTTQAVSPGYIYTVTASSEAIVRDVETDKLLCKANNGKQGMFVAIGGTVSMDTDDPTATITQASTNSGGARFEVQQTRPDTGEEGVIYLIPITSSTEEENEYEEWIWVKGEWERLGTTGVNLSNYATLTGANTYSGDNTFNGLLLKKNSASLGDTSVLNRSEADARYGRLDTNNTWSGEQYISADGRLTLHPNATIVAHSIQGTTDITWLSFNGLHLVGIADIEASDVKTPIVTTNLLYTSNITTNAANKWLTIDAENIDVEAANISGVRTLQAADIISGSTLYARTIAPINATSRNINLSDVWELQFKNIADGTTLSGVQYLKYDGSTINLKGTGNGIVIHSAGLKLPRVESWLEFNQGKISGVKSLENGNVSINYDNPSMSASSDAMLVAAPAGIKVTNYTDNTPAVTISPSKIEAFQLNAASFGSGKYGLRLTPDSCQLYGIDFAYGDAWSSYPVDGVAPAILSSDTVKIMKPALTLDTTGVASLAFGNAPKVLFRTFPNGGETAIFEFQAGNWSDDSHSAITTGDVDLRKPSYLRPSALQSSSLINRFDLEELTLIKTGSSESTFAVAIGYEAAANAMHAIAIGTRADVDTDGEKSIAIGFDAFNSGEGSVVIGSAAHNFNIDSVVIGARAEGDNELVTAVGPDATSSGERAVSVGQAALSTEFGAVAIGVWTQATAEGAVALGVLANSENIAIGCHASASAYGLAIGAYAEAQVGELNITVGGGPDSNHAGARCTMLLYGGSDYATRDTTGYLTFEVGNTSYSDREDSGALNDTITISKPNLWSALDRAKYRGAQPYASYAASAVSTIPALEPNSITHIYTATDAAIDLSDITLAQHDTAVTTAELWVEVTITGATITWPEDMLWPDEADPTTAPSFTGPEDTTEVGYTMQRLYCVTLRTQPVVNISTGNAGTPLLIATIAYTLDHKVPVSGS